MAISAFEFYGGEGGIRTLGRALWPYDGLANRCFRPLSHLSVFNSPDFSGLWSMSPHYTATSTGRSEAEPLAPRNRDGHRIGTTVRHRNGQLHIIARCHSIRNLYVDLILASVAWRNPGET